jgi:hypothetical protein
MHRLGLTKMNLNDAVNHIVNLTGRDAPSDDARELDYTIRYLVGEAIATPTGDAKDLLAIAYQKATRFISSHQFVFAVGEDENATPKLDAAGKPKQKKGAKKENARRVYDEKIRNTDTTRKEAIAILVEEVGLTPAGASTYYAQLKKGTM